MDHGIGAGGETQQTIAADGDHHDGAVHLADNFGQGITVSAEIGSEIAKAVARTASRPRRKLWFTAE